MPRKWIERDGTAGMIRAARKRKGWSQPRLARELDLGQNGQTTVSRWENGKTEPTPENMQKIANVLGIVLGAVYVPSRT